MGLRVTGAILMRTGGYMKVIDWMGRDIIVPCNGEAVWERVKQVVGEREIEAYSYDTWKRELNVDCYNGPASPITGYRSVKVFRVDISDLITGKVKVISKGYKGEVHD